MNRGQAIIWTWAASIVLVWIGAALVLRQSLWVQQHSVALTAFGAFEGRSLTLDTSWKLLASQWLHVKFPHMLFNALIIGLVGAGLTRRLTWPLVLPLGLIGGACGQFAGAVFQPDAYISGASQAYLALCGAGVLLLPWRSAGFWAAVVGTATSVALDLFIAGHAGIKPGHSVSFVAGLIVGGLFLILDKRPGRAVPGRP